MVALVGCTGVSTPATSDVSSSGGIVDASTTDPGGGAAAGSTAAESSGGRSSSTTAEGESTGAPAIPCGSVPGEWTNGPPMPLGPRQENGTVAAGGKLLVMGGYENILVSFANTLEVFDPRTVAWETGATLDEELHHPNFASVGERVFLLGFLRAQEWLSDGRVFELAGSRWVARAPMPDGTDRGGSGVAVVDGIIYVAGGLRPDAAGGPTAMFSAYDPVADAWTELPQMPTARHHLAAAAVDGIIYAVGGRVFGFDTPVDDVEAYDTATGEWTERAPLPRPRGGLSVAAVGGCVYAIGGEGNPDAPDGMFADNDVYDPATDRWQPVAPMPMARHGTHAAVIDDWIFIPGGGESQGQDAVHHLQVFVPN